jgi:hypothetical protein
MRPLPNHDGARSPHPESMPMKRTIHPEAVLIALLIAAALANCLFGPLGCTTIDLF